MFSDCIRQIGRYVQQQGEGGEGEGEGGAGEGAGHPRGDAQGRGQQVLCGL